MARQRLGSRLRRTSEHQSRKQTILFTFGIIIILFILLQFGGFFLNIFGNILFSFKNDPDKTVSSQSAKEIIGAPTLFDIPTATYSASISVSGISPSSGTVTLFLNDKLKKRQKVSEGDEFVFKKIYLNEGRNQIKARIEIDDDLKSEFTRDYPIFYYADAPGLSVSFPVDNSLFKKADKQINVIGSTDSENEITVNGFRSIVKSNGSFSYFLQLNEGANVILIEAKNPAGIKTTNSLSVTYEP